MMEQDDYNSLGTGVISLVSIKSQHVKAKTESYRSFMQFCLKRLEGM